MNNLPARAIPWLLCALASLAWTHAARAQSPVNDFERSRYSTAAYYSYAEPGDVTIRVNVWGTVRNPGLYEVPRQTHLSTLLSLAGGPEVTPLSDRSRRRIIVRLTRPQDGRLGTIYEASMKDQVLATRENPLLQEGDVLTVETVLHQRLSWRDFAPIVSAVSSVGLAIFYLGRL
ncbi:MAG TPA: SLBB domain-containing protein [Rhodothermales bacterium]|nr:SLBB domain-containing protein [Rhodothermales bacterium]